jgi:hypothetical protein
VPQHEEHEYDEGHRSHQDAAPDAFTIVSAVQREMT